MNITERLFWILDKKNRMFDEDKYKENIDFVHSLGKKCDCVGWSELDMNEPDAEQVLDKIQDFCKQNGWRARGWYERTYTDFESDWYELKTEPFKDSTVLDIITVPTSTVDEVYMEIISAYHEQKSTPKYNRAVCVSDRFRNVCIKNGITDVDFCWVKDKGKYEAEQYFYIFPNKHIPSIVYDKDINRKQTAKIQALGGYLPKIASVIDNLEQISLQDCYIRDDMPSGGIACVYCHRTDDFCGRDTILIHKDTAEKLIAEKAISRSDIAPACIVDKCPDGYTLGKTTVRPKPSNEYMENSLREYERLKAKGRPEYIVKEKEAVKLLRKSKSERKTDFNKKIRPESVSEISDSAYSLILPYYQVCDGGILSDEYAFLSYADSLKATREFLEETEDEELAEKKPDGIVLAKCADGDVVLVCENEKVIRFSHESPETVDEWQSLAKFFVEALNEAE